MSFKDRFTDRWPEHSQTTTFKTAAIVGYDVLQILMLINWLLVNWQVDFHMKQCIFCKKIFAGTNTSNISEMNF